MALELRLKAAEELGRKLGQRAGPGPQGGRKTTAERGAGGWPLWGLGGSIDSARLRLGTP